MKAGAFFGELKRRNVLRAGALYIASVWVLAQGIAQLGPSLGAPDWTVRWFLAASIIGFPFWIALAWFFEITPTGLKRENDVAREDSITRLTGRKLDFLIIGLLALVVVLLVTNQFVLRRDATSKANLDDARADAARLAKTPGKSIAVLPLANESGDKDQQYFSDGLSEDLITALSQVGGLRVIGRHSTFLFRNSKDDAQTIGAKLGVTHLLEGSVRREGGTVRISAELINASDGSTLWSQHYDRPYEGLFALQDEITQAVANALQAKLLGRGATVAQGDRPPSGNLAAYSAYLQGNFQVARGTEADYRQAIASYQLAINDDPRYARVYAALSSAWTVLAGQYLSGEDAQQAYAKARAAADTALTLEPNLAVAHGARGAILLQADFDWAGARAEYERAVQLAPDDGSSLSNLGNLMATLGHTQQAAALIQQALASDPLNARWYLWLAVYQLSAFGHLDDAEAAIHRAIELQPTVASYYTWLIIIDIYRGDATAALDITRKQPANSQWQAMALASQVGTDRIAADAALKYLIDTAAGLAPFQIAEVYALRRDPDQMFMWLDRAWASRDPGITYLLFDPFVLRYQHDPRFTMLCEKVGLPTTTDAQAMP